MMPTEDLEAIIDHIGEPVFVKDEQRKYVLVNDAFCETMGVAREDLIGKMSPEVFPDSGTGDHKRGEDRLYDTGERDVREKQIVDARGDAKTVIVKRARYIDRTGKRYLIGTITDITERKRMEEALVESEIKYRSIVEGSVAGVYILQDNKLCFVNRRACEIAGYPYEEMIGINPAVFIHPDDRKAGEERLRKFRSGEPGEINITQRSVRKDGTPIVVNVIGTPITYRGKPAVLGTVYDVTAQEKAREGARSASGRSSRRAPTPSTSPVSATGGSYRSTAASPSRPATPRKTSWAGHRWRSPSGTMKTTRSG